MSKRKLDRQLNDLSDAVQRLVGVFVEDLSDVRINVLALGTAVQELQDRVAFDEPAEHDDLGEPRNGVTLKDVFLADLGHEDSTGVAWRLHDDSAMVYSAGGASVRDTLNALLVKMVEDGNADPAYIDVHIGYTGVEDGFESEGGFTGNLTVAV